MTSVRDSSFLVAREDGRARARARSRPGAEFERPQTVTTRMTTTDYSARAPSRSRTDYAYASIRDEGANCPVLIYLHGGRGPRCARFECSLPMLRAITSRTGVPGEWVR